MGIDGDKPSKYQLSFASQPMKGTGANLRQLTLLYSMF